MTEPDPHVPFSQHSQSASRTRPKADVLARHMIPVGATGRSFALLEGISVLDLTSSVAGPYATLLLGDLGAKVLKIEPPKTGDDARHWGPPFLGDISLWFLSINRNKQSVALDYSRPQGRDIIGRLVASADVVVTNLRPSVQRKLQVDYASLRKHREDLIFCSITGFGLTGPKRDMACYDLIAEGYSGIMDITGEPDSPPQKIGAPAADLVAGADAAYAIVAALFDRQRTGNGHLIDVSLVESMTRFVTPRIVPYLGSGDVPGRTGARDSVIAIYQTFDTSDQPITLGLGNDAIFRRFCEAVGRPEWGTDERYADNAKRREARPELVFLIQAELIKQSSAHWLRLFATNGVPAGPVYRVDELVDEPQLAARGLFYSIPGAAGQVPQVGTGWHLDGQANGYLSAPPALGEHTEEVLGSRLGMSQEEITALRAAAII